MGEIRVRGSVTDALMANIFKGTPGDWSITFAPMGVVVERVEPAAQPVGSSYFEGRATVLALAALGFNRGQTGQILLSEPGAAVWLGPAEAIHLILAGPPKI